MGCLGNPLEEEVDPGFPVTLGTHLIEQAIILRLVGLKVEAEVEQRTGELSGLLEQQRDD